MRGVILESDKATYLQMLQESICRMSTISAIFKGFAATIVAGIASITYEDANIGGCDHIKPPCIYLSPNDCDFGHSLCT